MSGPIEAALRRQRFLLAGALTLISIFAAVYTVAGVGMRMSAVAMTFGGVQEPGATAIGQMTAIPAVGDWGWSTVPIMFLMWWAMMIAMMLPTAAPAILLYASVLKRRRPDTPTAGPAMAFTSGYLLAWAGFGLAATAAQLTLQASALVSPSMMMLVGGPAGALVAIAAGAYQFTPLKSRCLALCRAPAEFIARHHRPGIFGAFRLGALHGAYCLGCCIALMALLFVGGVMNLYWIFGLAAFVAFEKLGAHGRLPTRIAGGLLIGFGIAELGVF